MAIYRGIPEQAQKAAREQLGLICNNLDAFDSMKSGAKMKDAAISMRDQVNNGGNLTANQMNYIDGIYEKVMQSRGFDSVPAHIDKKRRTALRFG